MVFRITDGTAMEGHPQGVVLDRVKSHAFDVHSRNNYVAPGEFDSSVLSQEGVDNECLLCRCSPNALDAVFRTARGSNVRLCHFRSVSVWFPLRPCPKDDIESELCAPAIVGILALFFYSCIPIPSVSFLFGDCFSCRILFLFAVS